MRWLVISGVVAAATLGVVALVAPGGDPPPTVATNYRTTVTGIEPRAAGVEVRAVEGDGRLELVNRTDRPVTVLGYNEEPYLRVDADGVHENVRSPSLYFDSGDPPAEADAEAAPEWRRVGGGSSVRWHHHRAHWMGGTEPPEVAADPGRRHVVSGWAVTLLVDGTPTTVTGRLTWEPPPQPWPWYLGAGLLAAGLVGLGAARSRWRDGALAFALVGLAASAVVLTAGRWAATGGAITSRLTVLVLPLLALAPAAGALLVGRSDRRNRLILLGASVASLGGLFGLNHLSWLTHSQPPTALAPSVARLAVATALGTAVGALVIVASRTRALWPPSTAPSAPDTRETPSLPATGPSADRTPVPASEAEAADTEATEPVRHAVPTGGGVAAGHVDQEPR